MKQVARNLIDAEDGSLKGKRYLLMDGDTKSTDAFRKILSYEGVECVRLPPRSSNLNPHLERFMRSVKEESLERMIFFGEGMLRNAICEYLRHYHEERNHQGLANKIIQPGDDVGSRDGEIQCRERLGGLLRYYCRHAA